MNNKYNVLNLISVIKNNNEFLIYYENSQLSCKISITHEKKYTIAVALSV
ncbi:hypothetical protein NPX79_03355 [Spiroplasma endosymbiont of Anurida maritima]